MLDEHNTLITMLASLSQLRFPLLLKIGFVTLDPPHDSDKLCILLQGFVWETYVSDMKIVHKIGIERF